MWSDVRRLAAATVVVVAAATGARAQAPAPSPAAPVPSPAAPVPSPDAPASAADEKPDLRLCNPSQEICVTSAHLEVPEKGHTQLRGFVDIQSADSRIQADQVDLYEMTKVDGTTARRLVAVGNVVFMRGDERLAGERLELELDTNRGTFDDASGFVSPGVLVEAKSIERIDGSTYKIHGGRFTSCTQPNPRWNFSATSATLLIDDKVKARNVVFRVLGVPAFYIPYFEYPIRSDQRSTGFLFPHFGSSALRGFNIGTGFFWAMNRSFDQTFYADHYSKYGWGFGHEFRYMQRSPSRGTFRTYFFRRSAADGTTKWEHDFNWNAIQNFPWKVRGSLTVRDSSSVDFQQQFQESLDLASSRQTRSWTASLQRSFGQQNVQLAADSSDTYFYNPADDSLSFFRRRRLPSLTLSQSPRKFRGAGGLVFGYDARAEELQLGQGEAGALVDSYSRFDVNPRLSRPVSKSFLQVTPQAQVRYTHYGASLNERSKPRAGPLERKYFESGVEVRGPSLSRVFNAPGNSYSERFKHVVTPELTYTYRSKLEEFDKIPQFDGLDVIPGTNEVRYGLVQQFYAKRPGRSGKLEPYEFLNWRVGQTYYFNASANLNLNDPNYTRTSLGPDGLPTRHSGLLSNVRFRPTQTVSTNFNVEYDVDFHEIKTLSLSTNVNYARLGLNVAWSRNRYRSTPQEGSGSACAIAAVAQDPAAFQVPCEVSDNQALRGSARLQLVPRALTLSGSADYTIRRNSAVVPLVTVRKLIQSTARLRYDVQCCGFVVEMIQSDYNLNQDRQWRFSIELANIGSMGNFLGQDAANQNRGFLAGGR